MQKLKLRENMKIFLSIQISVLEHDGQTLKRVKQRLKVFSAVI